MGVVLVAGFAVGHFARAGLKRARMGWLDRALGAAFGLVRGVAVDWGSVFPASGPLPELPTYAFQRRRLWLDAVPDPGDPAAAGLDATGHPLLGTAVELPAIGPPARFALRRASPFFFRISLI